MSGTGHLYTTWVCKSTLLTSGLQVLGFPSEKRPEGAFLPVLVKNVRLEGAIMGVILSNSIRELGGLSRS